MKKIIALFLALVMAMSMTACTDSANNYKKQINELQKEIEALKVQINEQGQIIPEETVLKETVPEETVLKETVPEETVLQETVPEEAVSWEETLTKMINSNQPEAWLEVAKSDFATENHLKEVAKKTAEMELGASKDWEVQREIAKAISQNTEATEEVLQELLKSKYPAVWREVAGSNKAGDTVLQSVVGRCKDLSRCYPYGDGDLLEGEIVRTILDNSAATETVFLNLLDATLPWNWLDIAKSSQVGERVLVKVAQKSLHIDYYEDLIKACEDDGNVGVYEEECYEYMQFEIAKTLGENPTATAVVMSELLVSENHKVVEFAVAWLQKK